MRQIIIILALIALWPGCAHSQINQDVVNSDVPGGGGGGGGGGLSASDIDTITKLNNIINPDVLGTTSSQSMTNKLIDCNGNTCKPLRGEDCTAFNAATGGQYCVDTDDLVIYFCSVGTEEVCDDPEEWIAISSASTMAGLGDVTITTPQDDDVLVYDTGEWINKTSAPLADSFSSTPAACEGQIAIGIGANGDAICVDNTPTAADTSFNNGGTNFTSTDVQGALGELSDAVAGVEINGSESIDIIPTGDPVTALDFILNFANHDVADNVVMNAGEWVPAPGGFLYEGSVADDFEGFFAFPDVTDSDQTFTLATTDTVFTGDNLNPNVAGRSLTLNAGSPDTLDADPELYTDTKCVNIDPESTVTNWLVFRTDTAITVTGIDCIVDASTSVVLTPNECDGNGANCTAIESAITCGTTNTTESDGIDNASIDAGDYIRVTRGTVTGSPTQAMMCITYTKDD